MKFDEYRKLQQETTIEKLKVSYVVCGEGPTLLLIHGIPVWGYLWKECILTLSQQFQLIIPDLVGYGYSDQRDCFDRSIKVQSRIISKLLEFLDIEDLFVSGHDIGGAVAQRFVVDHAEKVKKWVLIDSVLYDSWPADPMVRLGNPKLHYRMHGDELANMFIERLPDSFYHREMATKELLEGWMAPYATEAGKLSLIRNAAALNTNHTMELIDDLKLLSLPLLLLWGGKDQFQPLWSAKRFTQEFPGTQLKVIADSDHFLPFEKAEQVALELMGFFQSG
ncbi:MAG: alpha/beta hydrolase [Chloroflexota bacterium]|nr:MAG: alpha/beta hydrolase [Chloroflexota bacterium]